MSILKTKFDKFDLKVKFNSLLESINPNNSSKLLAEMYVKKYTDLNFNTKVNNFINEQRGILSSDERALRIKNIRLVESAVKELKIHDWYAPVSTFITEANNFLKENENYILLESIILDLKLDKSSKYYESAIIKLEECANSQKPITSILETLKTEKWIPLVARLYEWAEKQEGKISGKNPNFIIESVYSPVSVLGDESYLIHSNGLNLVVNESNDILAFNKDVPQQFYSLLKLQESAKLSGDTLVFYPNQKNMVEVKHLNESVEVKFNGRIIEPDKLNENLKIANAIDFRNYGVISNIERAISEGNEIKELDFAYRIKNKMYEGLSVTVFKLNENIFIQQTNTAMHQNEINLCESAEEAIKVVKEFINFDITDSLVEQVQEEKIKEDIKHKQISECQENILFLEGELAKIDKTELEIGVNESLSQAKLILCEEIGKFNIKLTELKTI